MVVYEKMEHYDDVTTELPDQAGIQDSIHQRYLMTKESCCFRKGRFV